MIIIMLMSQVQREGMGSEESDEQLWQWQVNLGHCYADGGDDDKDHYGDDGGSYYNPPWIKVSRPLSAVGLKKQIELKTVQTDILITLISISH